MALKLNERYPSRFNNPSVDYPQGSFKNRTTPTAKDGSYLEKDWANDKEGFFQSLLAAAVMQANGSVDKVGASQYFDSLVSVIKSTGISVADTAKKLQTARIIGFTGAATGAGSFDGSSDVYITLTLSNNGVVPGSYSKVQIDSKGLVIGSSALVQGDIPSLDWSIITSGKPTTLDGYRITDALNLSAKATQTDIESAAPANKWIDPAGAFLATQDVLCGMIFFHSSSAPPPGSLKANGAWVSRTTYAKLFARIGTFYGPGDGVTSFALPDVRGEFGRFWDDARGVDPGRTFGSFQAGALEAHSHAMSAQIDWTYNNVATTNFKPFKDAASSYQTGITGGSETRPRNLALLGCIKY